MLWCHQNFGSAPRNLAKRYSRWNIAAPTDHHVSKFREVWALGASFLHAYVQSAIGIGELFKERIKAIHRNMTVMVLAIVGRAQEGLQC